MKRFAALLLVIMLLAACTGQVPIDEPNDEPDPEPTHEAPPQVEYYPDMANSIHRHEKIDQLFDQYFYNFTVVNPEYITWVRYPVDIVPRQDDLLTPLSYGYSQWHYEMAENTLERLADFDPAKLSESQQLTMEILQWRLEGMVSRKDFMYHSYLYSPLHGPHIDLPMFMQRAHTVRSLEDAENYVARLGEFETVMAQFFWAVETQFQNSIVPPDFIIKATIEKVNEFIADAPEENPIYTTFAGQLELLDDIDEATAADLLQQVAELLANSIYPDFEFMAHYLGEMQGQGIKLGLWELPDGKEYYELLVRAFTSTSLSPEEVHDMAREEAAELKKEILELMKELELDAPISNALGQIYQQHGIVGNDKLMEKYQQVMEELYALLPELFNILPKAEVIVLPKPRYLDHFPAHYISPAMDGSRPGVFKADTSRASTIWDIQMVTAHETVPGHHLERALKQELDHAHIVRNTFNFLAYSEGWATYAEGLIYEFGPYKDDEMGHFNYLVQRLWRAAIAVVDTGIHYMGWSEAQAQSYMQGLFGVQISLQRYASWPGQALGYFVGEHTMHRLRQEAMDALGDDFDIREFHDVILGEGALPLEMLEEKVREYIQQKLSDETSWHEHQLLPVAG